MRQGPYLSLPFVEEFGKRMPDTRDLTGLLERMSREAESHLRIAIPFFRPETVDHLFEIWTRKNPFLKISFLHRQGFRNDEERVKLKEMITKWSKLDKIEFRTLPERDLVSGLFNPSETTFHCKLIDPNNGKIILLSSNITYSARYRNVEIGYVFGTNQAQDFRTLIDYLFDASYLDTFANP